MHVLDKDAKRNIMKKHKKHWREIIFYFNVFYMLIIMMFLVEFYVSVNVVEHTVLLGCIGISLCTYATLVECVFYSEYFDTFKHFQNTEYSL